MTNSTISNENDRDSTDSYVWIGLAVFIALTVCVSIVFCGAGLWIVKNNAPDSLQPEAEITSGPPKDILKEISLDPNWKLDVNEEFKDNKNDWTVGPYENDSLTLERSIENGKYVWDYEAKSGWYFWVYPASNTVEDFVASVEIKHLEGNLNEEFGLVIRSYDNKYYSLEISEDGHIYFVLSEDDQDTTLMERTLSTVKVGESNQITVQAQGSHFTFYINGHLAGEISDDRLKRGYIGLFTSTDGRPKSVLNIDPDNTEKYYPSKFEVDNFKVWVPVSAFTKLTTLTPEKGRIVFVSNKDGNPEIYAIDTDGTDSDRLTNNKADDYSPKWSFDSSKIAFVSARDGNPEIYVMDANGTHITRITTNPADDLDPTWSPDGKEIAYSSNRDGNYEIYIYNLETGETKRLTENAYEDRRPDWSPNKNLIIYQSIQYGSAALYTLEISTGENERITTRIPSYGDSRVFFSINGSKIVYAAGVNLTQTGIMIYDLNTKKTTDVVVTSPNLENKNGVNLYPTWSADNEQIAFVSGRDSQTDIYIISSDGKSIFRVTNSEANERDLDWTED